MLSDHEANDILIYEDRKLVWEWMHHDGRLPTDHEFAQAIRESVDDWCRMRASGLDVVASSVRDDLQSIVEAMEDL
jgi:hypothetical protein